jgi:hypothetical protein
MRNFEQEEAEQAKVFEQSQQAIREVRAKLKRDGITRIAMDEYNRLTSMQYKRIRQRERLNRSRVIT